MVRLSFNAPNTIMYRNWKGEVRERRILPTHIFWGSNEWHTEEQWLVEAYDLEKKELRTFALEGFKC
jgi:predicted DNA-binding transcriptional regulator YafY